jgi:hypothetical protein
MIRYMLRTTPWPMLAVGCGVVVLLMALVAQWPWVMWPLQGTAVGVVAGVTAWAMDERLAPIVDTLPRPHWWRTVARAAIAGPVLVAVYVGCLVVTRDRLPDHLGLFALQGAGAAVLALGVTAWRRRRGTAEPGVPFATYVIPIATALALIRPVADWLPLFPLVTDERWWLSRSIWTTAAAAGVLALALDLRRDMRPLT